MGYTLRTLVYKYIHACTLLDAAGTYDNDEFNMDPPGYGMDVGVDDAGLHRDPNPDGVSVAIYVYVYNMVRGS